MGRKTAQLVPRGTGTVVAGMILLSLAPGVVLQAFFLIV